MFEACNEYAKRKMQLNKISRGKIELLSKIEDCEELELFSFIKAGLNVPIHHLYTSIETPITYNILLSL